MQTTDTTQTDSLGGHVAAVLARLHRASRWDLLRALPVLGRIGLRRAVGRPPGAAELGWLWRTTYMPLSPMRGQFTYLMARAIKARQVVEFGTSFGISTIYLAAAVRANGGGRVISTEIEETKWQAARDHLAEAGLLDFVDLRLGDALQTLQGIEGTLDFVLLDGWKEAYLPILRLLEPQLATGAAILADNVIQFRRELAPFLRYVQARANGYESVTLPLEHGFAYALYLGKAPAPPSVEQG